MTKFLTSFLLFSIFAGVQTATGQNNDTINLKKNVDWKTLVQTNYSIQYPSNWELNQSEQAGLSFILFSSLESEQDKFRENINLLIQDLTGKNMDLTEYTEISENQIETLVTNSNLIESRRIKKNTDQYQRVIYTGDQGVFHLKFEQYYFIFDNKAYVLTLTTEKTKFGDFKETGEKILNSFKLKK